MARTACGVDTPGSGSNLDARAAHVLDAGRPAAPSRPPGRSTRRGQTLAECRLPVGPGRGRLRCLACRSLRNVNSPRPTPIENRPPAESTHRQGDRHGQVDCPSGRHARAVGAQAERCVDCVPSRHTGARVAMREPTVCGVDLLLPFVRPFWVVDTPDCCWVAVLVCRPQVGSTHEGHGRVGSARVDFGSGRHALNGVPVGGASRVDCLWGRVVAGRVSVPGDLFGAWRRTVHAAVRAGSARRCADMGDLDVAGGRWRFVEVR